MPKKRSLTSKKEKKESLQRQLGLAGLCQLESHETELRGAVQGNRLFRTSLGAGSTSWRARNLLAHPANCHWRLPFLTVEGDGRPLFSGEIKRNDPPVQIRRRIDGVGQLTIKVRPKGALAYGLRVDVADPKVSK